MYNADAAQQLHVSKVYVRNVTIKLAGEAYRHRNSHFIPRNGVHRTTNKRRLEDDVSSNATFGDDLVGREVDLPGEHQEVVICKAAMKS